MATTIGAVSEAVLLAQAAGAIPGALIEALQGGFADSRILREHGVHMIGRDWRLGGRSRLQLKNLHMVFQQSNDLGIELPLLNQVRDLFQTMVDAGEGEHDHAGQLLQLERMNGPHRVGEVPDRRPED